MRLVQLIDSHEYVASNCWQHQLIEVLRAQADEHMVVTSNNVDGIPECDIVLSTLKLRSIHRLRHQIGHSLRDRKVFVYDQDPWESFVDQGSYVGAYADICSAMNVSSFINTSAWWAQYVISQGFESIFARMWPDPRYCSSEPVWSSRPIRVGYMGAMHPHRMKTIGDLKNMGVNVTVVPAGDYQTWLRSLSQMQFFIHDEAGEKWTINGREITKQCGWAKDVEIAARGCFSLRIDELESKSYMSGFIPAMKTFNDLSEVPGIISRALSSPDQSNEESNVSSMRIRQTDGWFKLSSLMGSRA